jgi:hypothetical protein
MAKQPEWNEEKLVRVLRSNGGKIYYNPLAHSRRLMRKCITRAKKKGIVRTRRISPDTASVALVVNNNQTEKEM